MGGNYWLASYPKSGNTWVRAFVHNLRLDRDAPADINNLSTGRIASGRRWLDEVLGFDTADLTHDEVERLRPSAYEWVARDEVVGYHKIHDACTLTADGVPLIGREGTLGALYIIRDPRDVAPSAASHWGCTLDEAIARMARHDELANSLVALPAQLRQRLLSWSEHVTSWVDAPGLRCEVVRYEDLLADPVATFTRAAAFLDLPREEERIEKAVRFSSFEELSRQEQAGGFRERPANGDRFFRTGRSGGWRESLSADQARRICADHGAVMRRFGYLCDDDGSP